MNRCETCRWWNTEEIAGKWDNVAACDKLPARNSERRDGIGPSRGSAKITNWANGYGTPFLATHKDFGCTLHEPREEAKAPQ